MALKFDGNTIESSSIILTKLDHYGIPNKIVELYKIANADRSAIPFVEYPSRTIVVEGIINCGESGSVEQNIDEFKGFFRKTDGELDVDFDGGVRRYIATVNTLNIERTISLTDVTFSIEFVCTEPYGIETIPTTLMTVSNSTTSSYTDDFVVEGTAPYQLPIITITIDAVSVGQDWLSVTSSYTGQQMFFYNAGFTTADVIVINSSSRTVTINGVETDYIGTFIEFVPGTNEFTYADGFASRTVDISISYTKRYL